jgi:hypothetical protein
MRQPLDCLSSKLTAAKNDHLWLMCLASSNQVGVI